jgi:hypothetical protein
MMLADAQTTPGQWTTASGVVVVILAQLGKWITDERKDKRDFLLDEKKQRALDRIADSNDESLIAQGEVKQALIAQGEIDRLRHDTVILALQATCKANGSNHK